MRKFFRAAAGLALAVWFAGLPLAASQARSGEFNNVQTASVGNTQSTPGNRQAAALPEGLWITANGDAVIQIVPCGNGLCGQIVGMFLGPRDPTPKDWAGETQCRLTIIQAAPQIDGSGQPYWSGSIVDPRDGSTYNAIIRLNAQNQLLLRGYVGLPIFGETQTWKPYQGTLAENCRLQQPIG